MPFSISPNAARRYFPQPVTEGNSHYLTLFLSTLMALFPPPALTFSPLSTTTLSHYVIFSLLHIIFLHIKGYINHYVIFSSLLAILPPHYLVFSVNFPSPAIFFPSWSGPPFLACSSSIIPGTARWRPFPHPFLLNLAACVTVYSSALPRSIF